MTTKTMIVILLQTVMIRTALPTLIANLNNALILIFLSPVIMLAFLRVLSVVTMGQVPTAHQKHRNAAPGDAACINAAAWDAAISPERTVAPQDNAAAWKVTSAVREGGVVR